MAAKVASAPSRIAAAASALPRLAPAGLSLEDGDRAMVIQASFRWARAPEAAARSRSLSSVSPANSPFSVPR